MDNLLEEDFKRLCSFGHYIVIFASFPHEMSAWLFKRNTEDTSEEPKRITIKLDKKKRYKLVTDVFRKTQQQIKHDRNME